MAPPVSLRPNTLLTGLGPAEAGPYPHHRPFAGHSWIPLRGTRQPTAASPILSNTTGSPPTSRHPPPAGRSSRLPCSYPNAPRRPPSTISRVHRPSTSRHWSPQPNRWPLRLQLAKRLAISRLLFTAADRGWDSGHWMTVLDWLLDSYPAIRWQVLRDLTDASTEEAAAERAKVATQGWGAGFARPADRRRPIPAGNMFH